MRGTERSRSGELARLDELTEREHDVLRHMARGATNAEIAEALIVGEATVKSHVGAIFSKLGVRDRAAAIVFAYDHGIVDPRPQGETDVAPVGRCAPGARRAHDRPMSTTSLADSDHRRHRARPTASSRSSDLRRRYGSTEVLRGMSFSVERGELFGLLGTNGAGKTTTVEILQGLRRADGGSVSVLGPRPADRR